MIKSIFTFVWRRYIGPNERVVKVLGWRTCYLDSKAGNRIRATFMPLATWRGHLL